MIPTGDMFCGRGGWSAAAQRTGRLAVRRAWNHDPDAIRWHTAAHPEPMTRHHQQDVRDFEWGTVADELRGGFLLASPSCKDFSRAGQPAKRGTGGNGRVNISALMQARQGFRNSPLSVVHAAEAIRPRVLVVENVDELTEWELFADWLGMLRTLGYHMQPFTINSADYGAAQERERVYIVGGHGFPVELDREWGPGRGTRSIADCLLPDEDPRNRWAPVDSKPVRTRELIRAKQRESGLRRGFLNNVGDGVRMRDLDRDLAPTLTTQSGTQFMLVDGDRVKILAPIECARLQGWTDEEAEGTFPANRKVASKLIGNAVEVTTATGILTQALEQLPR